MAKTKDRVKIEKRNAKTLGLDDIALDEYTVGGLNCVRFKEKTNSSPFDPKQPGPEKAMANFDCQLLIMTIPMGFRRINKEEIDNPGYRGDTFKPEWAIPNTNDRCTLLHVLYDLDPVAKPPFSAQEEKEQQLTQHSCAEQDAKSLLGKGVETPCAKSSANAWSGGSQALFVRYRWSGIYNTPTAPASHQSTHQALSRIFSGHSQQEVAMAAMVIPDRTIVWVPFVELGDNISQYTVKKFTNNKSYTLIDVAYLDKPGIWIDRKLRFKI